MGEFNKGGSGLLGVEINDDNIRPQTLDDAGNVLSGVVEGVPADGLDEYAVSCLLQRTDAAGLFINKGTTSAAVWSSITIP